MKVFIKLSESIRIRETTVLGRARRTRGGPEGPGNGWQHVLVVMLFHGLDELQACFTFLI